MTTELNAQRILHREGEKYLPLLNHILERSDSGPVFSGDNDDRIREIRLAILARNTFLFRELKKLMGTFTAAGIEVILLKGAMMESIYPPGLRPFTDIDFLVRREEWGRMTEVLDTLGYRSRLPTLRPGTEDIQESMKYTKYGKFPIAVEPHLMLGTPYPYSVRIEAEGLWHRACRINIAGIETLVLSPEDSLLHACLHLFEHRLGGWLATCCDIVELIYRFSEDLDWEVFVQRTFRYGLCFPVRTSLKYVAGMFHVPIPSFVLEHLDRYTPSALETFIYNLCTILGENEQEGIDMLVAFLTMSGVRMKVRCLLAVLLPSREFIRRRYSITNDRWLPWYYVRRWKDFFIAVLKMISVIARNRLK
jgi:hypothetical protein